MLESCAEDKLEGVPPFASVRILYTGLETEAEPEEMELKHEFRSEGVLKFVSQRDEMSILYADR